MTEPHTRTFIATWARWRLRAAVAVLAAAMLIAAGYLIAEYRTASGEPAATLGGSSPGTALRPAPGLSASGNPSALPSSVPPSAPASSKAGKPAATRPNPGGWPGPGNTGVPGGTRLAAYKGSCTISKDRTVVTGKLIRCDPLMVRARDVTIRRSRIVGSLDTTEDTPYSFVLEDSEVDGGVHQRPAVGLTNMTIRRSNIHGGQANVLCYAKCDIRDSWLHSPGLADGADWHLNGFLANATDSSGRSDVTLIHNTIECDTRQNSAGGGCSGDVSLFADFGPVSSVTLRGNLLGASPDISYCIYGGSSEKKHSSGVRDIVVEDNVFRRGANRKCGAYGPITSFDKSRPGNRWANNAWEDGSPVAPAN